MADEARRAASTAARLRGRRVGETVAAESRVSAHGGPLRQIALPYFAERLACPGHFGRIDAGTGGKCDQEILVSDNMLEQAGEKVGLASGVADRLHGDAGQGDEAAEPAIVLGYEGKRLNCQHFGRLRRVWRPLLHGFYLRFRKKSGLALRLSACRNGDSFNR